MLQQCTYYLNIHREQKTEDEEQTVDVSREQRRQRRIERVEKRCQEKAKKFLTSDRLLEDKTYLTNLSRGRSQRARKFKKDQAKKHVKLIFGHF